MGGIPETLAATTATSKLVALLIILVQFSRVLVAVVQPVLLILIPIHAIELTFQVFATLSVRLGTRIRTRIRGRNREEDSVATTAVAMNRDAMVEKVAPQQGRFGTLWQLALAPSVTSNPSWLRRGKRSSTV
jgi:hypothetical protein